MATNMGQDKIGSQDALVMVHLRNAFYKQKYHAMIGIFFLSVLANMVLAGVIIYLVRNPTHPIYFVADGVGRLIKDVPLTSPNMSNDEVAAWTINAVESAYSYDFVNYRGALQNAQKYFTDYGWRNYMKALQASNNLLALTDRKQIVIAKVVDKPVLLKVGLVGGAYAWRFQMHVLITYLSYPYKDDAKSKFSNSWNVSVLVQRQNLLQSDDGLGIIQMVTNFAT